MTQRDGDQKDAPFSKVSSTVEDYLAVLWKAAEWGSSISTGELAATLGVAASTVSANLRRIGRDGFINYEPYGAVTLTPAGRRIAVGVVRRHRIIETYLAECLGLSWDEVHDEANALEHAVSALVLARMDDVLGNPTHDPHGDAIPAPDGSVPPSAAIALNRFPVAVRARIVRISDKEPETLRYLADRAMTIGATITVSSIAESARALMVVHAHGISELTSEAAAAVWVIHV